MSRGRVLVVDDEGSQRDILRTILSAEGYANRTSSSSTDTGPAGSVFASGLSVMSGTRSSTSNTRSKLTRALMTSTRALASAVSGE